MKIKQFFGNLLFVIGQALSTVLFVPLVLVVTPFLCSIKKAKFIGYWARFMTWWLKLCCKEPFGGLAVMCSRKMYENLKRNKIRVLIDGNGADEIFGGYGHHINAYKNKFLDYSHQPVQGLKIKFPEKILKKNIE